jgi:hypothetical protein
LKITTGNRLRRLVEGGKKGVIVKYLISIRVLRGNISIGDKRGHIHEGDSIGSSRLDDY